MTNNDTNRSLVVVVAIASLLMLIFGLSYRILVAQLIVPVNNDPINPAALERLPLQIGCWAGQDVPLDEALVDATGTDAHISRRYSRHNLVVRCERNLPAVGRPRGKPIVCRAVRQARHSRTVHVHYDGLDVAIPVGREGDARSVG